MRSASGPRRSAISLLTGVMSWLPAETTAADARDMTADARESALDERERQLDRAAELGLPPDGAEAAAQRLDARAARQRARDDRADWGAKRDAAARARDEATARRLAATPTTRLASAFAAIAEHLYAADSFDGVLLRIAQTAVSTRIAGCQMASVTLSEHGTYQTAATTDSAAWAVDQVQYNITQQGPCLGCGRDSDRVCALVSRQPLADAGITPSRFGCPVSRLLPPRGGGPCDRRHRRIAEHLWHRAGCVQRRGAADRVHPGGTRVDRRPGGA